MPGPQVANAGYQAFFHLPNWIAGEHSLFVYARSSVTGEEVSVDVPLTIESTAPTFEEGPDEP